MGSTKYEVIALILFIMGAVSIFGAHFGYEANGIPSGEGGIGATPAFLYQLVTFQISGVPVFMSAFVGIMILLIILVAVSWIRGSD